ncbi:hypothetical protein XENOCAPTIV_027126, partial [Xenoophorus captivus]
LCDQSIVASSNGFPDSIGALIRLLSVAVDLSFGVWGERIEDQCEKMDEHPTQLSKQQLVQLIRSLILVEQVSCQEWGQVLLRNKEWDAVLEHSLMAWRYTSDLPQWDTVNHNVLREQCYSILAAHGLAALQHHRPEASRGRELLRRYVRLLRPLEQFSCSTAGVQTCMHTACV